MRMEDSGAFGAHEESMDDLRQKLVYTTIQLEIERMRANQAIGKHKERLIYLLSLLKTAYHERDEAREQLQNLLTNASTSPDNEPTFPQCQHPSFHAKLGADSSLTESSILAGIHHLNSNGLVPANLSCEGVPSSSQHLLNTNDYNTNHARLHRQTLPQYTNDPPGKGLVSWDEADIHRASLMIDKLVEGQPLPQKGKLLQAVIEAGPLLETLLVIGPLPKWKNPPPPHRLKPPPPIPGANKASHPASFHQEKPHTDSRDMTQESGILRQSADLGIAYQRCLASISNISDPFHPYMRKTQGLTSSSCLHDQIGVGKHQRSQ